MVGQNALFVVRDVFIISDGASCQSALLLLPVCVRGLILQNKIYHCTE